MEEQKKISVDELVNMIHNSKDPKNKPTKPVVVWFDNVRDNIRRYAKAGDVVGLASALADNDAEITFYSKAGSPLTDQPYAAVGNTITNLTDEDHREFIIPSCMVENGELKTKVFIHASIIGYIGEKGLTSFEYGQLVYERLKLPVFLFYSIKHKEKIDADFSKYDEYYCVPSTK